MIIMWYNDYQMQSVINWILVSQSLHTKNALMCLKQSKMNSSRLPGVFQRQKPLPLYLGNSLNYISYCQESFSLLLDQVLSDHISSTSHSLPSFPLSFMPTQSPKPHTRSPTPEESSGLGFFYFYTMNGATKSTDLGQILLANTLKILFV